MTFPNGGGQPCILAPRRTEEGRRLRRINGDKGATFKTREYAPRNDSISNTISTVEKDNLLIEPVPLKVRQATKQGYIECPSGGVFDFSYPDSKTRRGGSQDKGRICPTITTNVESSILRYEGMENETKVRRYRIRKLTNRECFRLMGCSESDIDKIQNAGISKSQQYKLAGNSIVVDCLYYIFLNLFTEQEKTTLF